MSDKLITEPCPWCGSDRIDAGYSRGYAQGDRKRPEIAAGCWDCSATGPGVLVPENSMGYAESAAKWNTMASAEKAKADLREKLRQQREACVKAYIDWITGKPEAVEYFSPEPAISNATIDNNGEDE